MNYKIITDKQLLLDFIDWLPELQPNEKYYFSLMARKKYCSNGILKSDKAQLKRFVAHKKDIYNKIQQLEIEIGNYQFNGETIPQESLALYVTPNPRCMKRGAKTLLKRLAEIVCEENYTNINPHSEALTCIHQSRGTNHFMDFDFDSVDLNETLVQIYQYVNPSAAQPLLTRGGFHILLNLKEIEPAFKKIWYNGISKLKGCDVRGDNLVPVVGTYQGGFTPKLFTI